jgi:hypothetical protein
VSVEHCVGIENDRRFEPMMTMARSQGGAVLVAAPILLLAILGAPSWVTLGYLLCFIVVAGAYVLRKRRASTSESK